MRALREIFVDAVIVAIFLSFEPVQGINTEQVNVPEFLFYFCGGKGIALEEQVLRVIEGGIIDPEAQAFVEFQLRKFDLFGGKASAGEKLSWVTEYMDEIHREVHLHVSVVHCGRRVRSFWAKARRDL